MSVLLKQLLISCPIRGVHMRLLGMAEVRATTSTERRALADLKAWNLVKKTGKGCYKADPIAHRICQSVPLELFESKFALPALGAMQGSHEHVGISERTFRKLRSQFHQAGLIRANPWRVEPKWQKLLNWYYELNAEGFLVYACGQEMAWESSSKIPSECTSLQSPLGVHFQGRNPSCAEWLLLLARVEEETPYGVPLPRLDSRFKKELTQHSMGQGMLARLNVPEELVGQ